MEDFLKVNMNEYLPLRDVVFNTLRQAILKGELEPGERLMEIQLADRLGVSRTPIREAIRKLELEGLVVMVPRKGAEVAQITESDLTDVLVVRRVLEELAVELACSRMDKDGIRELKENLEQFKKATKKGDLTVIAETDVHFHELIYKATENARLIQILNNLREQMYRYRMEYIKDAEKRAVLVDEHIGIIDAIENRDVKLAKRAIKQHVNNQEKTILDNLRAKE